MTDLAPEMYESECNVGKRGLGSVGREILGFLLPELVLARGWSEEVEMERCVADEELLNHFDGFRMFPSPDEGDAARGKRCELVPEPEPLGEGAISGGG